MIPRSLLFLAFLGLLSCHKQGNESCAEDPLQTLAEFPIGTSFNLSEYDQWSGLREKFDYHFNSLTIPNALKFGPLSAAPNQYNWSEADSLLKIAKAAGARVHGHTLIWHNQNPAWLEGYTGNYSQLLNEHIQTVVSRYKGRIRSWDVVNEAIGEDGTLRNSIWKQKIGADYIYRAFKAARNADPEAELYYNDFNLAINPKKLDAVIDLCEMLRERGVNISGIGMQMHIATSFPERRELADAVEKIWKAGFKIHFSELDVSVNILNSKTGFSQSDWQEQREKFFEVAEVYGQIPEKYQFGITFWGGGDADSWLPRYFNRIDAGLLFDEAYQPKPAFCGFKNGLE